MTSTRSWSVARLTHIVSGKVSSEVTKVPLAELRRLIVTESKVVGAHGEEGREEDGEVQGEVKGEVEENQGQPLMCMA